MLKKQNYKAVIWVDSENPTKEEARSLMEEFGLDPEVAQDILLPTFKDKILAFKDYVYLNLHFPAFKHTHGKSNRQEIDFVLGKKFVITNRYESIDALEKYSKIFEVNSMLGKDESDIEAGELFLSMMKTIYQALSDELDAISYLLAQTEKNIFAGKEKEMVFELSNIGREIINFNHIITPHGDILDSLKKESGKIFGSNFTLKLDNVINEFDKIEKVLENITEVLLELRETNNSLLTTKQNEIMKVLTIMAFVTFPLTLISSIFGMNTEYLPIVGVNGDFWIVTGMMVLLASFFFIFFKSKKWF